MNTWGKYNVDAIVPISIDTDWPDFEEIVDCILEQHSNYGFTHFILTAPSGGWRTVGLPPLEHYVERAKLFAKVAKTVEPYGIVCGWWMTLTLKSGPTEGCQRFVKNDGSETLFSTCPSDIVFMDKFNAGCFTEEEIIERLSKCVFLDGEAAKILCNRGFSKHLKQIETGSGVHASITARESNLILDTEFDYLYNTNYDSIKNSIKECYQTVCKALDGLENRKILSHSYVSNDVAKVVYDNNTIIYVNYGQEQYIDGQININPKSYLRINSHLILLL